jgi:dihydropteroate synthase
MRRLARLDRPLSWASSTSRRTPSPMAAAFDFDAALAQAERMVADGADVLDVGGESTRPGSEPVRRRGDAPRVPVIEALARLRRAVSVDTWKPGSHARRARGRRGDGQRRRRAARARRDRGDRATERAGVCLMHMQGTPATMQSATLSMPMSCAEVTPSSQGARARIAGGGIARERIVVDPGFGFGKTLEHNLMPAAAAGSSPRPAIRCWSGCRASRCSGG